MSYHIYTTRGLVLSERPRREADRIYSILTEEFGLVRASAGGVRKEKSKLRASLEPFSVSKISFVRGKEYWRITNSVLDYNIVQIFEGKKGLISAFAKAFSLTEKLLAGESAHPELVKKIEEVVDLARSKSFEEKNAEVIEILLVTRALFELGYLSRESVLEGMLEGIPSPEAISAVKKNIKSLIKTIHDGIMASDLTN